MFTTAAESLVLNSEANNILLARIVQSKRAYSVGRSIVQVFRGIPDALISTMTFDNGKDPNADSFFAKVYPLAFRRLALYLG